MHFTFTPTAIDRLAPEVVGTGIQLRLLYDTEGCGCVMNGVPTLQLIDTPFFGDAQGTGDPYPVWYEPNYEVFFEPRLKIDYNPSRNAFVLKSDNQTYTTNLRLLKS
ncbi:iron-sulfur cluster biosynthesis family protein [Paenibacillus methanolicus]|uniref:Uncharacterized protein YqkB n=1 Tax=Paenibacillus methanolicus TaxID=582686 RepID=A0A5S5BZH6_9BACL|nr:iron-sulfur cluster biosynthesis family protein [Paenibacillus methanolicus]TYP72585.1 uncharacterized protein YqkB [Paenibacillus methanolicus]